MSQPTPQGLLALTQLTSSRVWHPSWALSHYFLQADLFYIFYLIYVIQSLSLFQYVKA